MPHIGKTRAVR